MNVSAGPGRNCTADSLHWAHTISLNESMQMSSIILGSAFLLCFFWALYKFD